MCFTFTCLLHRYRGVFTKFKVKSRSIISPFFAKTSVIICVILAIYEYCYCSSILCYFFEHSLSKPSPVDEWVYLLQLHTRENPKTGTHGSPGYYLDFTATSAPALNGIYPFNNSSFFRSFLRKKRKKRRETVKV